MFDLAIIGAGFSGTVMAAQLLRQTKNTDKTLRIALIEKKESIGQGTAYGTTEDCHLLNVPAGKMSALSTEPQHFLNWLQVQSEKLNFPSYTSGSFVPRRIYGLYLQDLLTKSIEGKGKNTECVTLQHSVEDLEFIKDEAHVFCKNGEVLKAKQVVLATGNYQPLVPKIPSGQFEGCARYVNDPWAKDGLRGFKPNDDILIIGTGLTMVDLILSLHQKAHRGTIHAVSFKGFLPQPHKASPEYPSFLDLTEHKKISIRKLTSLVRHHIRTAEQAGGNWRAVIDSLRPKTQALWTALSLEEKRRFLRHVRPFWDVHRHRIAPDVFQLMQDFKARGQLVLHAGRLQSLRESSHAMEVKLALKGSRGSQTLKIQSVINCTGPNYNALKNQDPLIQNLLKRSYISPHILGMGLQASSNGAMIQQDGTRSTRLYTLGGLQIGELWENTAVPDLRVQVEKLSKTLLGVWSSQ
ncbi:MAG: FAD/NAD(P)-binding protein [Oligoflexales bacterium]|nr:FAD/NAD(P)-binding protein [Oligoflexales bacterium]